MGLSGGQNILETDLSTTLNYFKLKTQYNPPGVEFQGKTGLNLSKLRPFLLTVVGI